MTVKELFADIYSGKRPRDILFSTCILLFALILPFGGSLVSMLLLPMGIIWLIDMDWKEKWKRIKANVLYFLPLLLFILYIVGMIYSDDKKEGWENAGRKVGLIIFPALFLTVRRPEGLQLRHVFVFFITGCVLVAATCFGIGFFHLYQERHEVAIGVLHDTYINWDYFFASRLSYFIHPSYEAMYVVFAQFLLIRQLFSDASRTRKIAFVLLNLFLAFFVLLLASRAGMISLVVLFSGAIVFYIIRSRKYFMGLIGFAITIGGMFAAYRNSAIIASRFDSALNTIFAKEVDKTSSESSAVRRLVWNVSADVIRDNWLLGVGTGDVKNILEESYRKNGMEGAFSHKLNTHNQYLQTFAAIGIFGFLTLLGMIMIPLFFGGNRTDAIMVVFVTLFAFNILVESMFETHAGIFFFGFFYTIIPFLGKREDAA